MPNSGASPPDNLTATARANIWDALGNLTNQLANLAKNVEVTADRLKRTDENVDKLTKSLTLVAERQNERDRPNYPLWISFAGFGFAVFLAGLGGLGFMMNSNVQSAIAPILAEIARLHAAQTEQRAQMNSQSAAISDVRGVQRKQEAHFVEIETQFCAADALRNQQAYHQDFVNRLTWDAARHGPYPNLPPRYETVGRCGAIKMDDSR